MYVFAKFHENHQHANILSYSPNRQTQLKTLGLPRQHSLVIASYILRLIRFIIGLLY